jgi:hypothetical protein
MPDARDLSRDGGGPPPGGHATLVAALKRLPQQAPAVDAWPALAGRLAAARRSRRRLQRWLPLAAAATLALALVLPRTSPVDPALPPAGDAVATIDEAARIQALIARSQWLERLAAAPALAPVAQDGDQALLELGLRERIGRIDAALADPQDEAGAALWQARIGALDELVQVRWAGRQVALAGHGPEPAALTPAVLWSN